MPTKAELEELSYLRLKEARVLYKAGHYRGAHYLAGYTIELSLKARICKILNIESYFNSNIDVSKEVARIYKTHDLTQLLFLSGLKTKFEEAKYLNEELKTNWGIVNNWNEGYRYLPVGPNQKAITLDFLNAIDDSDNGVFTWIKKHW